MPKQGFTLESLAAKIDATVVGDSDYKVRGLATLQDAGPEQLSFLANPSYQRYLTDTRAGAVILTPNMAEGFAGNCLLSAQPYLAYAKLTALFVPERPKAGVHASAVVAESAQFDTTVSIGPNVVIEDHVVIGSGSIIEAGSFVGHGSVLGKNCRLFPNVTVYSDVVAGDNVTLHPGCVIGGDGFGFAPGSGGWQKIHQLGGVRLGSNVEVGASTTIDRGALGDTVIADGVIIDNLVQIAHNVHVGENTAIAGCAGIAGSTKVGKHCTIAGGAGLAGHLDIADNVHITGMALISKSIREPGSYSSGTHMMETSAWRKSAVRFTQLEAMNARVKKLEKQLERLLSEQSSDEN